MRLSDAGEFGLIHAIQQMSKGRSPVLITGIGDDAAVLRIPPTGQLLVTTDMLLDGVHFDLAYTDLYSLGWKAAAVNLSDIAAMGGTPQFCLTSIGLPRNTSIRRIQDLYKGFNALMRANGTLLVGGDTCASHEGIIINVTLFGRIEKGKALLRSGARQGDKIFVTGTLGDSGAGLELVRNAECGVRYKKQETKIRKSDFAKIIARHLRPEPRVEWGRTIALGRCANAMIDISDGLSSDLGHICEQSGVGAVVYEDLLPLSGSLRRISDNLTKPPSYYALHGGEDYELLFTVPPSKMNKLASLGIPVTQIGEVTRGNIEYLVNGSGKKTILKSLGYDHFKRAGRNKPARQTTGISHAGARL